MSEERNLLGIPDVSPDLLVNPLMPTRVPAAGGRRRQEGGESGAYVAQAIARVWKAHGWSDAAIAGGLANVGAESGFEADGAPGGAGERYAFQFNPRSHLGPYREFVGKGNPADPALQAEYVARWVDQHMPGYGQIASPQEATDTFMRGFEAPANPVPGSRYRYLGQAQSLSGVQAGDQVMPPVQWPAPTQYAAAPAGYGTGFVPGGWGGPPVPMGMVPTTPRPVQMASIDPVFGAAGISGLPGTPGGPAGPSGLMAGGAVFNPPGPVNYPANPVGPFGVGGAFPQQVAQQQFGSTLGGAFNIPSAATQPGFGEGAGGPSGPGTPASGQTVQMNPAQMPQISKSTAMFGVLAALAQGYKPVRINYNPLELYRQAYQEPTFPSNVVGRLTPTESPTIQRTVQPPGGIQQEPSPFRRFTQFY